VITVSVTKKPGLTASFERSFDDANEAARFAESWLPMHVRVVDSGKEIDVSSFLYSVRRKESALRPFQKADGSDETCPFCDAPETPILADDELLHACGVCDRCCGAEANRTHLHARRHCAIARRRLARRLLRRALSARSSSSRETWMCAGCVIVSLLHSGQAYRPIGEPTAG
jgi:hypothetical protein